MDNVSGSMFPNLINISITSINVTIYAQIIKVINSVVLKKYELMTKKYTNTAHIFAKNVCIRMILPQRTYETIKEAARIPIKIKNKSILGFRYSG